MKVEAFILDAFTLDGAGGNAAAVVLETSRLDVARMQAIAASLALSETAFVVPDPAVDVALRFFTPTTEIDYCGHATVASIALLHECGRLPGRVLVQGTRAGRLRVRIADDGEVLMNQRLPQFGARLSAAPLATILGLAEGDLEATGLPVQIVSTGLADILVPVGDEAALNRIRPDMAALSDYCRAHHAVGVHAFALTPPGSSFSAVCRNFAPLFGIAEESATGSAAGALASYLGRHAADRCDRHLFLQGRQMGRASRLSAQLERDGEALVGVVVGGYVHRIDRRVLDV